MSHRATTECPEPGRRDPVRLLVAREEERAPELLQVRRERMAASPYAFFRGAGVLLAHDLAATTRGSGPSVQLCGDADLSNVGLFAGAGGRLDLDFVDFDETDEGPWEWDVRRLATSLHVAGRERGFTDGQLRTVSVRTVRGYRRAMREFATMSAVEVQAAQPDDDELRHLQTFARAATRCAARRQRSARTVDVIPGSDRLTEVVSGRPRLVSHAPSLVPVRRLLPTRERRRLETQVGRLLDAYGPRPLLDRFALSDLARVITGVGTLGIRCWVVLLVDRDTGDPLVLQIRQALATALVTATSRIGPRRDGERVVRGQRLLQATVDPWLGWLRTNCGDGLERDYYVSSWRERTSLAQAARMASFTMAVHGELCGWTLARAHARAGDRLALAAHLGRLAGLEHQVAEFAATYADRNERDHRAYVGAVRSGAFEALASGT